MADLSQLEFLRAGIGLVPVAGSGPDTAIHIETVPGNRLPMRSCTCATARRRTCEHLQALGGAIVDLERRRPRLAWDGWFSATLWHRLARLLQESDPQGSAAVRVRRLPGGELLLTSPAGEELACWLDGGSPGALRLLERTGKVAAGDEAGGGFAFDRGGLLDRLALFQLAPHERELAKRGFKTQRQTWEESFWYRLAYHCVREAQGVGGGAAGTEGGGGANGAGTFHPAVEGASGRFTLSFRPRGGPTQVRVTVPRGQVEAVLRLLAASFPAQEDLAISPVPLRSILHVSAETSFDRPEIEVRPAIQAIQAGGEARYFAPDERFRYGNLVYLPELGVLAALERAGQERKFRAPAHLKLTRSQVPAFLAEHGEAVAAGYLVLDERLRGQRIWKHFDSITLSDALERSWTWIGVHYGFGSESVSLADLLQARRDGLPYLETGFGWIDLGAPAFEHLGRLQRGAAGAGGTGSADAAGQSEGAEGAEGAEAAATTDGATRAAGADETAEADGAAGAETAAAERGQRLSLLELLRLQAAAGVPVVTLGEGAAEAARLLDLRPAAAVGRPAGLRSVLRHYQETGADWLRFLVENGLGGLLCDDMGLGKTHQVMALMVSMVERGEAAAPFLVVCPTSVASHWRNKLRDHAPSLAVRLHHGSQRSLPRRLAAGSVVITSYGVLRRDGAELALRRFAVAVFDEAQHLKNPGTQAFRAAAGLDAGVRLGLTGTPIENSLGDLKALFDLVLPGYLGSDADFARRYQRHLRGSSGDTSTAQSSLTAPAAIGSGGGSGGNGSGGGSGGVGGRSGGEGTGVGGGEPGGGEGGGLGGGGEAHDLAGLRRLIAPFVLRRTKGAVLAELPEKIEDVRTCALSDDQVKLYRDAIAGRGADLARELEEASGPLPYIHIFALLNLLKQICDHPALALNHLDDADRYASGKWDLYREVIEECLGSGLKVVVFTQYLGMIRLMAKHLEALGVDFVTLTGASGGAIQRGAIVDRFNNDPSCRVFLGSLKAGGTGIDLVGGSVVIHYDRWWNAAREDQATDRVHRLGQRRAVHVLKLIAEGTLEEKISAIIDRKRGLLGNVIAEDDPTLAKAFTRDELLDLLRWPAGGGTGGPASGFIPVG